MKRTSLLLVILIIVFSCKNKENESTSVDTTTNSMDTTMNKPDTKGMTDTMPMAIVDRATATLSGTYPDTTVSGEASFTRDTASGKVKMELHLTIPSKAGKSVAVHIHEHGDCGDKGNLAHGHWNPTNESHGKWGSAPFHSGDIGNIKLDKTGHGTITLSTERWTLGGTADKNILRKALIVHGGTDDYKTQPTGNAGSRIGCGVIQ